MKGRVLLCPDEPLLAAEARGEISKVVLCAVGVSLLLQLLGLFVFPSYGSSSFPLQDFVGRIFVV